VGKWVIMDRVGLDANHYVALGVHRTATSGELKKGYKAMAREYHPDKVQGMERMETAEEKFSELTHMSEILQNDVKRDIYDRFGDDPAHLKFDPRQDPTGLITHVGIRALLWGVMAYFLTSSKPHEGARPVVLLAWLLLLGFELLVSLTPWSPPDACGFTEREIVLVLHSIFPAIAAAVCGYSEYLFVDVQGITEDTLLRMVHVDNAIVTCMNGAVSSLNEARTAGVGREGFAVVATKVDEALREIDVFEAKGQSLVGVLKADSQEELRTWINVVFLAAANAVIYHVMEYVASTPPSVWRGE